MRAKFGTLRQSTVMEIFKASLSKSGTSRAQIAQDTHISVMTVGKAVDALISLDVLSQSHLTDSTPGRPCRALYPSRHKWIAVYNLSPSLLSFYMLDLSLKIVDSFEYEPVSSVFPDDEIKYFANLARIFAAARRKSPDCAAVGILIPCGYDTNADKLISDNDFLSKVRPAKLFDGYTFDKIPYIGNTQIFNSSRISKVLEEGVFATVFYLDRGDIKSTVITKNFDGADSVRLKSAGSFSLPGGKTLNELSQSREDVEEFCDCFSELVVTAACVFGVNTVILCGSMCDSEDRLCRVIGDAVFKKCADSKHIPPEIISGDIGVESAKGISEEMRNKWFFEEMLNTY